MPGKGLQILPVFNEIGDEEH